MESPQTDLNSLAMHLEERGPGVGVAGAAEAGPVVVVVAAAVVPVAHGFGLCVS